MRQLDIRNLLENIEKKVYLQEITTDTAISKLINKEIADAINLQFKKETRQDDAAYSTISCTTLECYVNHLKAVEEKLKTPYAITAQCKPVEEREINRRLLLILNRLKGYSRK